MNEARPNQSSNTLDFKIAAKKNSQCSSSH
jgi:hypothetical protein